MTKETIFITGATGFIGSQVVVSSLSAGYRVRLSVRRVAQIHRLEEIFSKSSDIEYVVIPDLTKSENYESSLTGVDYVFHIASPMPGTASDLQTGFINPAVNGTTAILDAALSKPSIKKVIIMASILSLAPLSLLRTGEPRLVKGNTGQKVPLDLEALLSNESLGNGPKYQISKILAHQASRDWAAANNPHFILASMHPTFVLGPSLIQTSAQEVDTINGWFLESLRSGTPLYASVLVDVRDVADAFVKTISADVASGTEFILSGPKFTWKDVIEFVKEEYPEEEVKLQPPEKDPFEVDVSSAEEVLGMRWRNTKDTIRNFKQQQRLFRC